MDSTYDVLFKYLCDSNVEDVNIFKHLTMLTNKILEDPSQVSFQEFEAISNNIKQDNFNFKYLKEDYELNAPKERFSLFAEWMEHCEDLITKINSKRATKKSLGYLPDFVTQLKMFEWAGYSFGEDETYKLSLSLRKLARSTGVQSLRFWGKIYGRDKDYYIAEGEMDVRHQGYSKDKEIDPRGTGLNTLTYWVTDNLLADWVELPDVTNQQVEQSRTFKYIFTGDLNAKIQTTSATGVFQGRERHLLRAQITRITHNTMLAPTGYLSMNEEDQVEIAEDFTSPSSEELGSLETWVHVHPSILKTGKLVHPEIDPEAEDAEEQERIQGEDPIIDRFRALNEDNPIEGQEKSWTVKLAGDPQQYKDEEGEGNKCYGVTVLKSLHWPGAVTCAQNGSWSTIYVGYGLKHGALAFTPQTPGDILEEPDDNYEHYEPNPNTRPEDILESDSDEDKNKGEEEEEEAED